MCVCVCDQAEMSEPLNMKGFVVEEQSGGTLHDAILVERVRYAHSPHYFHLFQLYFTFQKINIFHMLVIFVLFI